VETLNRAGVPAKQIGIAMYDRERGHNPIPRPRGNEVYAKKLLKFLKAFSD
jgi:hypothetical protein